MPVSSPPVPSALQREDARVVPGGALESKNTCERNEHQGPAFQREKGRAGAVSSISRSPTDLDGIKPKRLQRPTDRDEAMAGAAKKARTVLRAGPWRREGTTTPQREPDGLGSAGDRRTSAVTSSRARKESSSGRLSLSDVLRKPAEAARAVFRTSARGCYEPASSGQAEVQPTVQVRAATGSIGLETRCPGLGALGGPGRCSPADCVGPRAAGVSSASSHGDVWKPVRTSSTQAPMSWKGPSAATATFSTPALAEAQGIAGSGVKVQRNDGKLSLA